tara:strand:+ start:419 stop:622 length:204 start_codon:yes stop_codon:yes gene_type:complete
MKKRRVKMKQVSIVPNINMVDDKECKEAIDYFWKMDMLNNGMKSDERHYCEILLKRVANTLNIKLEV